ncbi:aminotransferase class V-fold PLP-dependent enzyme [Mycobacterium intracellulare]|uniref:aminotransferase class V-fold PLP-dependent enzyme n=1 Tax=Mycobacterium intracellulare TaxID=1767 RepID=UPI001EEE61C0|nr:aminotransferase class V-fold PLP-dependent enzyme [Mycobacterium intracellulare]MEE3752601.1 aminotransferase class V-fold PLP-dependent enzyme [Mycobacterium intracellulare]
MRNEFTSVTFPFAAQHHRGVTVTESGYSDLIPRVCEHDLVAISVVQSADGTVMDLDALQVAAGETGALVLLDVTQAAGWLPLQLHWAHFVVGAGYKWLLTPRGAAWMAIRPDVLSDVAPQVANWSGAQDMWASLYGLPLRLSNEARRLDSSPVWFAQRGAAVSLPWVAGLDVTKVRKHCVELADATLVGLGAESRGSAIISLDLAADSAERVVHAGATVSTRAGQTRLSFHLYNTMDDVDLVLTALR